MGFSSTAQAVDGTITITGEIVDQTCKINGAAPPANMLVKLPKISNAALKNKNDVAGATPFTIRLTECPTSIKGEMKAYFEPGATTDYDSGNLLAYDTTADVNTAHAGIPASPGTKNDHVQIQLINLDGSAIKLGTGIDEQKAAGVTLTTHDDHADGNLRYIAQYIKTGDNTVTAGKLVTYVNFSLVYP